MVAALNFKEIPMPWNKFENARTLVESYDDDYIVIVDSRGFAVVVKNYKKMLKKKSPWTK